MRIKYEVREKSLNGNWEEWGEFYSQYHDLEYVAEDYLEDEYKNKDGWEYFQSENDTKEIQVRDTNTNEVKNFILHISYDIAFHADEKAGE